MAELNSGCSVGSGGHSVTSLNPSESAVGASNGLNWALMMQRGLNLSEGSDDGYPTLPGSIINLN